MAFRRVSSHPDQSMESSFLNSTRTVSSSSSMISTPSNRKLNATNNTISNNNNGNGTSTTTNVGKLRTSTNLITKSTKNKKSSVNLVKNKLLNLQKSLKIYTKKDEILPTNKNFIRKPINMNSYDYSVFTNHCINELDLLPCIKESQIKAWESAEKISDNLIFDNDSDFSDEEDNSIVDAGHLTVDDDKKNTNDLDFIKSIPGYTKEELEILLDRVNIYETSQDFNFKEFEAQEKQILYQHRQELQKRQESYFNQYQSLLAKRKIQITQKKTLLTKIFGYLNLLNQEYITNNTSYSSLDNVMNTSKSYQEDKDEINQILKEDRHFQIILEELKDSRPKKMNNVEDSDDFDYDKFQKLISTKMTELLDNDNITETNKIKDHQDLVNFSVNFLRKCVKYE